MIKQYYALLSKRRLKQFVSVFPSNPGAKLLGLGVGSGDLTCKVANKIGTSNVTGLEINAELILDHIKQKKLIDVLITDMNEAFPIESNSIDIISADQVIEHIVNIDNFVQEIHRVLVPGGYAVICTENLSAWHNILALVLGWQAFSQTLSSEHIIGKPLSASRALDNHSKLNQYDMHIHIFTMRGLRDLFEKNGFEVIDTWGCGYFPLPLILGTIFEKVDPTHSYFIGMQLKKIS